MTLEKNQEKTGHLLKDSPNDTVRKGRSDGTGGPQRVIGHRQGKGGKNAEQATRPFDGFDFAGNLALKRDGKLTEDAISNPSKSGDRIGGQPVGSEE